LLNGRVGRGVGQMCRKELLNEARFGSRAFEDVVEYSFDYNGKGVGATKNLHGTVLITCALIWAARLHRGRERATYVDNHVPDNFVIGNEFWKFLLGLEKAAKEVAFAFTKFGTMYTLHKAVDREAGSDSKVVEFVKGAGPFRVFAKPFVKTGNLANLYRLSRCFTFISGCGGP